jgi:DNA-binding NtrC family response regulator
MVATKRVLVLDDEDVVCRSYERVLNNAGFEVEKASNGKQALENIENRQYDVMLADLRMPGMDGLQVVRKLRQTHPKMPVIVITGYPSQDTLQEAASLGVADYLTKPVTPDVLTQAAAQAMSGVTWNETAPYLQSATLPAVGRAPAQFGGKPAVPEGMPVVPQAAPIQVPTMAPVQQTPVAAPTPTQRPGIVGSTVQLAGGLAMSLAYVMFLPLAGFFVMLGLGGKALFTKLVTKGA